jgi:hypothetical protein
MRGREQDSGETERERECERQSIAVGNKIDQNICDRHVRLISEVIKMLLMVLFP